MTRQTGRMLGQRACAGRTAGGPAGGLSAASRVAEGVGRKGLGAGKGLLEHFLGGVDALRIPLVLPHSFIPFTSFSTLFGSSLACSCFMARRLANRKVICTRNTTTKF
jgi:hypothetical protein